MISRLINNAKQIFQNDKRVKKKGIIALVVIIIIFTCVFTIQCMKKRITVNVDGQDKTIITYKSNVEDVLKSNGIKISKDDSVQPSLETKLVNNDKINIRRSIPIVIKASDKKYEMKVLEGTIENMIEEQKDALKQKGLEFNSNIDEVYPDKNSELKKNMCVKLVKVEKKNVTEQQPIKYETVIETDENLDESYKQIKLSGINGEKTVTYQDVYKDGKLYCRREKSSKVLVEPQNEIIVKGTAKLSASRGGANAGKILSCSATAYSGGWGTSSGRTPRRVVGGLSTIAVDPSFIPMGSKVYVEGYGYAVAADTGTAIKGNKIDLYFNSYEESCRWGLKQVNVTIIAGPGQW